VKPDQKFFDIFSIIIGVLVAISFGIYILADQLSEKTQGEFRKDTAEYQAQLEERIRPVGKVRMPGDDLAAPPTEALVAVESEEIVVAQASSGADVYNSACMACHTTGAAGAPVIGNVDAWTARIAQGMDVLYSHAIGGFQGASGAYMPPKGGRMDLSDNDVKAAVDYMVSQSQ
jgi:cytochrome c5